MNKAHAALSQCRLHSPVPTILAASLPLTSCSAAGVEKIYVLEGDPPKLQTDGVNLAGMAVPIPRAHACYLSCSAGD